VPQDDRLADELWHILLDQHVKAIVLLLAVAQSWSVSITPTRATFCRVRPSRVVLPRSSLSMRSKAWIVRQKSCSTLRKNFDQSAKYRLLDFFLFFLTGIRDPGAQLPGIVAECTVTQ
jgi:hypothetical protein